MFIEKLPVLRTRSLSLYYREIASLLSSGVSIIEVMSILAEHPGSSKFKEIDIKLQQDLAGGTQLGEAFSKFPDIFPSWHICVIEYSAKAGKLGEGFETLSTYLQRDYSTQLGFIVGLAYPALLLNIMIFLLPLTTVMTNGVLGYLAEVFKTIALIYGSLTLLYIIFRLSDSPQLRSFFHRVIINLPWVGRIVTRMSIARFMLALHALCDSGVPIITAWKMAAEASGNESVKERFIGAAEVIEGGQGLSKAFIQAGVCDSNMIGLIRSAEKTGNFVDALNTVYKYYDKEIETTTKVITQILPVIIYIIIASFIGFRVIVFYTHYFDQILKR